MSQAQPSPTSPPSSLRSSPTSSAAERTEQPEIRYAETDDDCIAIHRFLLIVAKPQMMVPVDPIASMSEVLRVAKQEAAIMAILDGYLVGTMGLIKVPWWYNPSYEFLTERWHFVLPQYHHGPVNEALVGEAEAIAEDAGLQYVDPGKIRVRHGRARMLSPRIYDPERE